MSDAKAVTLPEPNTPQERKWFAEQMGWKEYPLTDEGCAAANASDHPVFIFACGDVSYHLGDELWKCFNPRTSIADAIELADALRVTDLHIQVSDREPGWDFTMVLHDGEMWDSFAPQGPIKDQLCTAICEAVRAKGGNDADR